MERQLIRYVALPLIAPLAIVGLYLTPVELVGCANRGLMAVAVALVSVIVAFVIVGGGLRDRLCGQRMSLWKFVAVLILTLPLLLLLGPLG